MLATFSYNALGSLLCWVWEGGGCDICREGGGDAGGGATKVFVASQELQPRRFGAVDVFADIQTCVSCKLWKVSAVLQLKIKIQETPSTETFYGFVNVENVNMGSAESIDDSGHDADR